MVALPKRVGVSEYRVTYPKYYNILDLIYLNFSCHIYLSINRLIFCLEIQLWLQTMNLTILITWGAAGFWYASTTCNPAPFNHTHVGQSYLHCLVTAYQNYYCSRQAELAVSVVISGLQGVDSSNAACEAVQGGRLEHVDCLVQLYYWQYASYWVEEALREQLWWWHLQILGWP